jgi:tetratricopeptide (TPR) repeat protein
VVSTHTQRDLTTRFPVFGLVGLSLLCLATGCHVAASGSNVAGVRAVQSGQSMAGVDHFQKALHHEPTNADAYYNLAATYHELGKKNGDPSMLQQAEALYNKCLDLSADHPECHRALAVLLIDTRRSENAFTLLERWAQRSPTIADPKIELARLYEEFGDKNSAMNHLNQALAIDSQSSRAWAALGNLREQSGDVTQALANYQRSYQLNNFQTELGHRIASLQRQGVQVDTGIGGPSGTRLVQAPATRQRY